MNGEAYVLEAQMAVIWVTVEMYGAKNTSPASVEHWAMFVSYKKTTLSCAGVHSGGGVVPSRVGVEVDLGVGVGIEVDVGVGAETPSQMPCTKLARSAKRMLGPMGCVHSEIPSASVLAENNLQAEDTYKALASVCDGFSPGRKL